MVIPYIRKVKTNFRTRARIRGANACVYGFKSIYCDRMPDHLHPARFQLTFRHQHSDSGGLAWFQTKLFSLSQVYSARDGFLQAIGSQRCSASNAGNRLSMPSERCARSVHKDYFCSAAMQTGCQSLAACRCTFLQSSATAQPRARTLYARSLSSL